MAKKTQPEAIIDAIKADFHTYLRKGVRLDSIIGEAHTDLDIADVESLLRVHFVLTSGGDRAGEVGVIDFVDELPNRIRRLKTTTTGRRETVHGEIRGTVDHHETLKRRSQLGRLSEPLFVCLQREKHFDTQENLVLKHLLAVIRDILQTDLQSILDDPAGYEWLDYWTTATDHDDELPYEGLIRMYRENIYLQRISVADNDVTARMIESVKRSRSELYRDAATLLDRYRRLMRRQLTDQEAREVLNNTMITPHAHETLFELYWIFRLLRSFEGVEFRVIREGRSPVIASWNSMGSRYTLYHDATGDHSRFREELDDSPAEGDGFQFRIHEVLRTWQELGDQLLNRGGTDTLWGGRPDIVLEKTALGEDEPNELEQVFVGEVKYTTDPNYAATGLRELLEYMAFVRRESDQDYVEAQEDVLDSTNVHGLLFVDQMEVNSAETEGINIVQFEEEISPIFGTDRPQREL